MTGSAYQAMDVLLSCDSLYRVGVWGRDYAIIFSRIRGWRMTGSASNAMDVLGSVRKPMLRAGVWGREGTKIAPGRRLADCSFLGPPKI